MIHILNQQKKFWINTKKFKRFLKKLTDLYRLRNPEVTLVFVGTKAIKRLNRLYLKRDALTDVLSFPLREKASDGKYYLGDIVISVPQAFRQCFPEKHGLERELEILTMHGFLHLLGYEHGTGIEEEEEKLRTLFFKENDRN